MPDFEDLDFYELLNVQRTASLDEIRRAYRREISKYHPDRFVSAAPDEQMYAQQRSQRLTGAYSVLSDPRARSAYNLNLTPGAIAKRQTPSSQSSSPPAQPRDYQAELYEQAQTHLAAGRKLQTIGVLRQLQQINPFYRDSAELLAKLEAQAQPPASDGKRKAIPPFMIFGGLAGIVGVSVVIWIVLQAGNPFGIGVSEAGRDSIAVEMATEITPGPSDVTSAPAPTDTPLEPTEVPPTEVPPTEVPPTEVPPTEVPPTEIPPTQPPEESGTILVADGFDGSEWANLAGFGWRIGYQNSRYRIAVDPGIGNIWSFRTNAPRDVSIGVDVQVISGAGGLLLRYVDDQNFLGFSINPAETSYRLEQRVGGNTTVLAEGQSTAIINGSDVQNRLVVRMQGSQVQLIANGEPLANVEIPTNTGSARYGMLAVSSDIPAEVIFDNLELRTLE
ncbi:MAG: molecular chaperone DnaJ [Chloroflexi bacterium AL-W]|nr:molecular chaperone DnaJ [Chloroflexi bacterium AL-N1]NOK66192.1 molecular chaperone DnaJ [Chloroflexi bacterium AL-N10]NOK73073.1 molecular chaperone DnaJ [Chloroflexi bacterium AL-N5]NOK79970.1 molecular chaperone DnaJ [Chloroflexi bacterium AL-W]NOK88174.1 molecular chaperone DnaJ [Chloroflexi bacterium AL-N15]